MSSGSEEVPVAFFRRQNCQVSAVLQVVGVQRRGPLKLPGYSTTGSSGMGHSPGRDRLGGMPMWVLGNPFVCRQCSRRWLGDTTPTAKHVHVQRQVDVDW